MVEAVDSREKPGLVRPSESLNGEKYSPKVSPSVASFPNPDKGWAQGTAVQVLSSSGNYGVEGGAQSQVPGSLSGWGSGRGLDTLQGLWLLALASCCPLVVWPRGWPAPLHGCHWCILAGAAGAAEVCGG